MKDGVWIVAMLRSAGLKAGTGEIYADMVALLKKEEILKPGFPPVFPSGGEASG
jgi:hypothetical protein